MNDFINSSSYLCMLITFLSYGIGSVIQKKWNYAVFNPLLLSVILSTAVIYLLDIDLSIYREGNGSLSFLLTPATICLALPLYDQFSLLKKNFKALSAGIVSGVVTNCLLIFIISKMTGLDHTQFVTLLPKSVTTAIGLGISEELGGVVSITVLMIIFTGVFGNMSAKFVCRLFRITEPLAQGIGIGTASHVIGTSKALEFSETAGAASSLSIALTGILTVLFSPIMSLLY